MEQVILALLIAIILTIMMPYLYIRFKFYQFKLRAGIMSIRIHLITYEISMGKYLYQNKLIFNLIFDKINKDIELLKYEEKRLGMDLEAFIKKHDNR